MLLITITDAIVAFITHEDNQGNPYSTCKIIGDFTNKVKVLNNLQEECLSGEQYEFAEVKYYSPNTRQVYRANGEVYRSVDGDKFELI